MSEQSELRDQALLDALGKQIVRVPVPMVAASAVISGMAYKHAPLPAILAWFTVAVSIQVIRFVVIRKLIRDTATPAYRRLRVAGHLSLVHGIVLASSITFFPYIDETSRAIYSMILIGIVCGAVATSHGYRPVFLGLTVPILTVVAFAWIFTKADSLSFVQTFGIAALISALGVVLYVSSKDVYETFGVSFRVRQELEVALEAERSANAAKTRFLAAASHDLRQPLHTMSMLSAALTLRDLDDRSREIAERMNFAMTDLSKELDSLLDISKLDAGVMRVRPSEFELNTSLQRLIGNYQEIAKRKGLSLSLSMPQTILVNVDKALFERVVRNLLDNAVKYTHHGSVAIEVISKGSTCEISLKDTGIGIPLNEQEKVKEEFYQLTNPERDRQKGLGLGLSIVWRLIPLIDASLSMTSTPAVGTCYTLTLPTLTKHSVQPEEIEDEYAGLFDRLEKFKGFYILLVEDDLAVRHGTRTILESGGFAVLEASGTAEAVSLAKQHPVRLALVDLRLPKGDSGFHAISSLRSIQADLPIIILSGETTPEALQQSVEEGCEFMVKPVQAAELLYEISAALEKTEGELA